MNKTQDILDFFGVINEEEDTDEPAVKIAKKIILEGCNISHTIPNSIILHEKIKSYICNKMEYAKSKRELNTDCQWHVVIGTNPHDPVFTVNVNMSRILDDGRCCVNHFSCDVYFNHNPIGISEVKNNATNS